VKKYELDHFEEKFAKIKQIFLSDPDPSRQHWISTGIEEFETWYLLISVADPEPHDPYVFGPPGSGSISTRYGSGSFYNQAKIVRKTIIPTVL
jgi:hypothetical protein